MTLRKTCTLKTFIREYNMGKQRLMYILVYEYIHAIDTMSGGWFDFKRVNGGRQIMAEDRELTRQDKQYWIMIHD